MWLFKQQFLYLCNSGVVACLFGLGLLSAFSMPVSLAAATAPDMLPRQLTAKTVCGDAQSGVRRIMDEASLAQAMMGNSIALGGGSLVFSSVDFKADYVLLVSMGDQRTGGFALRYQPKPVEIDQSVATLYIEWIEPRRGQMLIQMLTQPCLVLAVPKGPYKTIQVKDQTRQLLGTIKID